MRVKVRSVVPKTDGSELEEFVVEAPPDGDPDASPDTDGSLDPGTSGNDAARDAAHRNRAVQVAGPTRRKVTANDLGPNGDRVFDLIARAAHLTPVECRRLEEEAGWRWWSMTPFPGTSVAGARGAALVRGRSEGRADAIVALETAVQAVLVENHAARGRGSRLPAVIANAGLAVLVRDLIEPETFEALFGPWREVMHH